jgi:hypothetical protein
MQTIRNVNPLLFSGEWFWDIHFSRTAESGNSPKRVFTLAEQILLTAVTSVLAKNLVMIQIMALAASFQ